MGGSHSPPPSLFFILSPSLVLLPQTQFSFSFLDLRRNIGGVALWLQVELAKREEKRNAKAMLNTEGNFCGMSSHLGDLNSQWYFGG